MTTYEKTPRNQVIRAPKRGAYDKQTVYEIIDAAMICHVGFVQDGQPFVIPTLHARQGDKLLLHGATTSRLIKHAAAGNPLCITVTLVDGLVLARSAMHHSANYRSAVVFGQGSLVSAEEKMAGLQAFTDRLIPGRWADARQPNHKELKATAVVAIPMESASAKVRVGPPKDDEADYELPVWAGVLPIKQIIDTPEDDPRLEAGIQVPDYVQEYIQAQSA